MRIRQFVTPTNAKEELFCRIVSQFSIRMTDEIVNLLKTSKGNTQEKERIYIDIMRHTLRTHDIPFEEAPSQQSKDFRNVGELGLHIEMKKTDSYSVYFNDTCPTSDMYYIVIFTGKTTRTVKTPATLVAMRGDLFTKDSPWIEEYVRALTEIKDRFCRGEAKKRLSGMMEVYARPTFKADIRDLLMGEGSDRVLEPLEEELHCLSSSTER